MESEVLRAARPASAIAAQFWQGTLPYERWNHAAHLAVALDAVARWGRDETLARLRTAISAYNEANAVQNSLTSGYHETLTVFFVGAVANFYQGHENEDLDTLYLQLLQVWGDKNAVFAFYSRRYLFSPYARMEWRSPDIAPLPFEVLNTFPSSPNNAVAAELEA